MAKIRMSVLALAAALCILLSGCGGGSTGYGVKAIQTLVEQEYSLAFRNDDPTAYYIIGAIQALDEEGKLNELSTKWFGQRIISFPQTDIRLEDLAAPSYLSLIHI